MYSRPTRRKKDQSRSEMLIWGLALASIHRVYISDVLGVYLMNLVNAHPAPSGNLNNMQIVRYYETRAQKFLR